MADEKQNIDSLAFSATAHGIFESATDLNSGRDALLQAYQSANWTDPKSAEDDLQYYGQALKYKLQDQTPFSSDVLEAESPIPINLVPREPDESEQTVYSRWEELNQKYLDETKDPQYVVAKEQWKNDIKDYASDKRRLLNAEQADKATDLPFPLKQIGEFNQGVSDLRKRAARGALAVVEPIVNSAVNIFTDNYELNSHLTEYIDPRNDSKLLSQVAEGAGSAAASVAAFAVNPALGVASIGVQATDAVGTRYQDTLRRTGDETKARDAALIETGSQAIQAVGEKLVFGKLGKVIKGAEPVADSTVKTIAKSAVGEGTTEGAGQLISSFAEDIERNTDTSTADRLAQAGRAGLVGGIVGGGAGAATTGFANSRAANVSKANTNQRETEIAELGYPITPVTKQVVGQLVPGVDTQNAAAPTEVDLVPLTSPEQLAPQESSASDDVANMPAAPAFTTTDGQQFLKTEDGFFVTEKDGVRSNPHDQMVFVDEANAQKVAQAITSGENVILGEKGSVAIERVEPGKLPTYEEIPTSDTPSSGLYALPISRERAPNAQTRERLIDVPRKIDTVFNNQQSIGAGFVTNTGAESAFSKKIKETPGVEEALRASGIYTFDGKNVGFSALNPTSLEGLDSQVTEYVNAKGIDGLFSVIDGTSTDESAKSDANFVSRAQVFLTNYITRETASGDPDRAAVAGALLETYGQQLSNIGSAASQALGALRGKEPLVAAKRVAKATTDAYETALAEGATEEGATLEDVKRAPQLVETAAKEVEAATVELQDQEKAVGKPITTEETIAEDTAVADIEAQASEKLAEDLNLIEQETQDLSEEIAVTEKKAARQKRKDIAAVEEAIATDGEQLAQAVVNTIDLQEITAEESAKLDESIKTSLKAAEDKANAEIKKAVSEERANKVAESKSVLERANEALAKATAALNASKVKAQERLRKLTYEERELTKAGRDITETRAKIARVEESVTKAAQRKINAEQRLADLQAALSEESEANKQAEEIYKELESGVQVTVTPQKGNKRAISLKTKKGGLDITGLFKKNKDVGAPLGALSKAVNELAGVVRQSLGARAKSNAALDAIEKRIAQNQKALDTAKSADALGNAERKRVDAARKRLEQLAKAKSEATLESRVSPRTKKLYKELKNKQSTRPKSSNSEAIKAAAKKLNEARAKQRRALKLLEKQKLAKQLASEAAAVQGDKERKVAALKALLAAGKFDGTTKAEVEAQLARAEYEADPTPKNKLDFLGFWVTSLVGNPILTALAFVSGVVGLTTNVFAGALPLSAIPLIQNLASGKWKYKLPVLDLIAGLTEKAQFGRSVDAARIAFKTGDRVRNTVDNDKIRANLGLRIVDNPSDTNFLGVAEDALTRIKNLKWDNNFVTKAAVKLLQAAAYPSGIFMRSLAASEAIVFGQSYNGFARYKNAVEYNKALKQGSDTSKFDVKPSDNMLVAEARAATEAKLIRDAYAAAGIPGQGISKSAERIRALEIMQQMNPEETQVFAYKMASNLVLNGPAGGMAGAVAQLLNHAAKSASIKGVAPLKYFTAFANSVAHMYNQNTLLVPILGQLDAVFDKANLDPSERAIRLSAGLTGTTIGAAIIMQGLSNLDLPEDERPWDIYAKYSDDKEKTGAFLNGGGQRYSIRIGKTYIPYNETGLGMWLAGIGSVIDRTRNGKDPDAVLGTTYLQAAMDMAGASIGSVGSMSMVSGITSFANALKTYMTSDAPTEEQEAALVKAIYSPVRGFIPSASFFKYLSRYTDNPVDTKRDIKSIIVEGLPGLQSAFGKPALNVFGEPLPKDDVSLKLHRLFSNKTSDLDIRWLVDNGYQTPGIENLNLTKRDKELTGLSKPDYEMKYAAMEDAAPAIRETVRKYRTKYGSSASREAVQKALTSDIQAILARSLAPEVKKYLQAQK